MKAYLRGSLMYQMEYKFNFLVDQLSNVK